MKGPESMWLLLLLAFVLGTAAQDVKWSPRTFPNPGVNVTRCGRGGLVSRVCDPDRLLSKTAADSVDGILKDVVLPVQPYAAAPCSWLEPGRQGFQVGVAVMKRMRVDGVEPQQAAAQFAQQLFRGWGVGDSRCGNGAVLLLATEDRQVYMTAGQDRLSQAHIATIISRMKPSLKAGDYDTAVRNAVVDIGIAFAQQTAGNDGNDEAQHDWGLWLFGGLFASIAGLIIWSSRKASSQRRSVQSLFDKLKREQLHARQSGRYPASSCPICLADFSAGDSSDAESSHAHASQLHSEQGDEAAVPSAPPLSGSSASSSGKDKQNGNADALNPLLGSSRGAAPLPAACRKPAQEPERKPLVLPCGHTFCESCIGRWLGDHSNCPVCRRAVTGEEPRPSPPPCQQQRNAALYNDELTFRLATLSRMYPTIVTQRTLDDMRNNIQHGTVVDWDAFRASEISHEAQLRQEQSGASGSGFGSFSGGGGGGAATHGGGGSW